MGRIKSKMIKNTARTLIKDENFFKAEFEWNKKLLKGSMPSKSIRNKIAGYLARLKRAQESEK